jgi:L-fuculose-phosphate aldolase
MTTLMAVSPAADTPALRQDMIEACRALSQSGHIIGTWGNISIRVVDGLLITPSRVDYAVMQPEDMVVVSWDGHKVSGTRPPSSELELHRLLLQQRPDLGAIVHTHSLYATVLACAHRALPVCVEDMAQIIGGEVRCSAYVPGGHHRELAIAACDAIGDVATAVLLANHGPVAGGRTLAEAVTAARILEKAAFLYVNASLLGHCAVIAGEAVAEERDRFLHRYGKEDIPVMSGEDVACHTT